MPRAGLSEEIVVAEAAALLDAGSVLSLAPLAERLGVRVPSLYKHVDGLPALERAVMIRAKLALGDALSDSAVGRSRDDAVMGMARAYRDWALANPGQYALTQRLPAPDDAADASAMNRALAVIVDVLAGYGLQDADAIDAARFLRSSLHGFVLLEIGDGFGIPQNLDRSFDRMVRSITTALAGYR